MGHDLMISTVDTMRIRSKRGLENRSCMALRDVEHLQHNPSRLDVANDTLRKLCGRGSILNGVGQMSSRDNKSTIADGIQDIAVHLGTTGVDISEGASLKRVAKSKSSLEQFVSKRSNLTQSKSSLTAT
jgi:hypothetical protein